MAEKAKENEVMNKEANGVAANLGKKMFAFAAKAQESIVNAVDKNGDGKIDGSDFGLTEENIQEAKDKVNKLALAAGQSLKAGSDMLSQKLADSKLEMELKTLRPVFLEEFQPGPRNEKIVPDMVRIVGRDKKRDESVVCRESVGYRETVKGLETLCLYQDRVQEIGLHFHPVSLKGVYYADPYRENFYISIDEYFNFLRKARINELEVIAQKLGAKYFRVVFKENDKNVSASGSKIDGSVNRGAKASFGADRNQTRKESTGVDIGTEVTFRGHSNPVEPELIYFANESDIEKLIQMRTGDSENWIQKKTYYVQCSKSSGFNNREASTIDAALGQLKCGGSVKFSSEMQREINTVLEYEIEF